MFIIYEAKMLREPEHLAQITKDYPGIYQWWAPRESLQIALDVLGVSFEAVQGALETMEYKGEQFYCIYVGIAENKSLNDRVNWHLNRKVTLSTIEHKTVSTLRQSVAAILGVKWSNTEAIDHFMDTLLIGVQPVKCKIKSPEAKVIAEKEDELINAYLRLLNIAKNHHPLCERYMISNKLTALRAQTQQMSLR